MTSFRRVTSIAIKGFFLSVLLLITSACLKNERSEEAFSNGTRFELEVFSQKNLETTERYRIISMTYSGTDSPSIMVSAGSTELGYFPVDLTMLNGTAYTLIDTVKRGTPTERPFTLYLDPARFYKKEYDAIVAFAQENYARPDAENKLLQWLNTEVAGLEKGDVYFTVYAIVHQKLAAFEPEYFSSDSKDWLRIQVNNTLLMHTLVKDGLRSEGDFGYRLKHDTLFYPTYERRTYVDSLLMYRDHNGIPFSARVKALAALSER